MSTPQLPPPLPPPTLNAANPERPRAPTVAEDGPPGAFLLELLMYNGYPFKDHWAYFVQAHHSSSIGVRIHATGAVNVGFKLEIQRMHNLNTYEDKPYRRIPLQWLDGSLFDEVSMFNHFSQEMLLDDQPVCLFEKGLFKIAAPERSLNNVSTNASRGPMKKITQRDCQTWIVESADQLVLDGLLDVEVAVYMHRAKQ